MSFAEILKNYKFNDNLILGGYNSPGFKMCWQEINM